MTYDAENQITSVTYGGVETRYVYAADGSRLKRIDNAGTASEKVTLYLGPIEIQDFGAGTGEVIRTSPLPNIVLVHKNVGGTVEHSYEVLHSDQLGSTRLITDANGDRLNRKSYAPFGAMNSEAHFGLAQSEEDRGYIGERLDRSAGLQYLNARYYDPELGLFTSPDWFEVMDPGVGTNRFAYSANDPVNKLDPSGNVAGNSACSGCSPASNSDGWTYDLDGNGDEFGTYRSTSDSTSIDSKLLPRRVRIGTFTKHFGVAFASIAPRHIVDHQISDEFAVEQLEVDASINLELPSDGYKTEREAVNAMLPVANALSIGFNQELGGMIYSDKSGFGFTGPVVGSVDTVDGSRIPAPAGSNVVADFHTHGDFSDYYGHRVPQSKAYGIDGGASFSLGDVTYAKQRGLRHYLGTPDFKFKTYP